jgi:hypothetical protein
MKVLKSLFTKCLWTILAIIFGWLLGVTTVYATTDSEMYKRWRQSNGLE